MWKWKYVVRLDNPADCASRRLYQSELIQHELVDPCGSRDHLLIGLEYQLHHRMTCLKTSLLVSVTHESPVVPFDRYLSYN